MTRFIFSLAMILSIHECVVAQYGYSEPAKTDQQESKIEVINWGKRAAVLSGRFWENIADTVIKQVGAREFEYMKKHGPGTYPEQMILMTNGNMKDPDDFYKKMGKLNYELAAMYRHFNDEGDFIGMYALLRVPYNRNKNWDKTANWDTVYFVFPMKALRVVN